MHRFELLGFPMNVYELGIYNTKYSPVLKYISLKRVKLIENYWIWLSSEGSVITFKERDYIAFGIVLITPALVDCIDSYPFKL